MSARDTPLHAATQSQLVEELARRLNRVEREEPPEQWCDNCVHFRTTTGRALELNPKWNPCAKKHAMNFYVPQDGDGPDTFGYYIEVCADRAPVPEPTPPEPPKPPKPPPTWTDPDFRQEPPPRGRKPRPA